MAEPGAPTTELGQANPLQQGIGPLTPGWSTYVDDREYIPELSWPTSVMVYPRMETDAQLNGLLLGTLLPVRRFRYLLDCDGVRPPVREGLREDLGLPVLGDKSERRRPRRLRNRFNHGRHVAHALRSLVFGHYFFEQVGEIDADELWRLRKLATRPPRTIGEIQIAKDGGLVGIKQLGGLNTPSIPVSRLVAYVWESEDDGDWVGRSLLRACYRNWLVKDRLIRNDATKHERNSMGVPWFEVDPNASDEQIKELAATAARWRAGEEAGGAGPGKLSLKGIEGSVSDVVESLRWHDAQMARSFLQTFAELATAPNGSRALADSLLDWYVQSQDTIGDFYAEVFTAHVIEDWVDWNFGPDEAAPALVWRRDEDAELATADLAQLVDKKIVTVDDELEDAIRESAKLPKRTIDRPDPSEAPTPPPPPDPSADPPPPAPEPATTTASRPRDHVRQELAEAIDAEVSRNPGQPWAQLAKAVGSTGKNGTARRARDSLLESGRIVWAADGTMDPAPLRPSSSFRRELYDHEVAAATDFQVLEGTRSSAVNTLVLAIQTAQVEQIDQIEAAIAGADGDLTELAQIDVAPIDTEVIAQHMREAAAQGEALARQEARAQGVKAIRAAEPTKDEIDAQLAERAKALALVLANSIAEAGSRHAVARTGVGSEAKTASEVAAEVKSYLAGLSDSFLAEQSNAAIMQAINTGRREFMRANNPDHVYASELMDENTCSPCSDVDGTEWSTVEAAEADAYPAGGYIECEGGPRCRGTLVAVYTDQSGNA